MSARVTKSTKRLRDVKSLIEAGLLAPGRQDEYEVLAQRYDIGITPHVLSTIQDRENSLVDPVGRQYVPSLEEIKVRPDEMADPIGDEAHSPVKGLVHRYPDRVLLKVSNVCAVYCRYCFRREMIGAGSDGMGQDDLDQAMAYIAENKGIWEVILTGGDPLVLSSRRLQDIVDRLNSIEHVQIVRIHTRVPVANPSQINDTVLSVLKSVKKSLHIVMHINHPQEITPETEACIGILRDVQASLLSQSVLLKGVNDDAEILEKLFRRLVTLHVRPYYLHHPDMAKGTSHFRVSLARGREIMKKLRGRVSGLCLPSYVLDIPGGHGKAIVEAGVCEETSGGIYTVTDYKGVRHVYHSEEGGA